MREKKEREKKNHRRLGKFHEGLGKFHEGLEWGEEENSRERDKER